MERLSEEEIEEIRREVMEEFPDDPALQQVHIARRILALEAKKEGKSIAELSRSAAGRA
jgi:hypothetical protein